MKDKIIYESSKRITQFYDRKKHYGIDLGYRQNEEQNKVYANCKGIVYEIQDGLNNLKGSSGKSSWGNYVLIKHDNGMFSRYAHLKRGSIKVKLHENVNSRTVLGIIGDSGNAYGRHLHFEVSTDYNSATRINPYIYLTKSICEESINESNELNKTFKYKLGDKVILNGYLYRDSKGNGRGQSRINFKAIITKIASGTKPYNLNNGLGWVSEKDLKLFVKKEVVKYTVRKGDTLSSIARKYNTTWQKIYEKNKSIIGNNPNLILPNQVLIIED